MNLLPVGSKVEHHGHGLGKVVGYNTTPPNPYLLSSRGIEILNDMSEGVLPIVIKGTVNALYDNDRYPYIIKFVDGYKDVYGRNEIIPVK